MDRGYSARFDELEDEPLRCVRDALAARAKKAREERDEAMWRAADALWMNAEITLATRQTTIWDVLDDDRR